VTDVQAHEGSKGRDPVMDEVYFNCAELARAFETTEPTADRLIVASGPVVEKGANGRAYMFLASQVSARRPEVLEHESAELAANSCRLTPSRPTSCGCSNAISRGVRDEQAPSVCRPQGSRHHPQPRDARALDSGAGLPSPLPATSEQRRVAGRPIGSTPSWLKARADARRSQGGLNEGHHSTAGRWRRPRFRD
jgi:hypothetical protein